MEIKPPKMYIKNKTLYIGKATMLLRTKVQKREAIRLLRGYNNSRARSLITQIDNIGE